MRASKLYPESFFPAASFLRIRKSTTGIGIANPRRSFFLGSRKEVHNIGKPRFRWLLSFVTHKVLLAFMLLFYSPFISSPIEGHLSTFALYYLEWAGLDYAAATNRELELEAAEIKHGLVLGDDIWAAALSSN